MPNVAPHEWEELQKIVRSAAKEAVRKWPDLIDADDVEQDVMIVLLESPASSRSLLDADPPIQRQMALRLCQREASKEMTDYEHWSGQYTYESNEVKALLEEGALTKDLEGFVEEIIDLIDALQQMTWEKSVYVDPLLSRFVAGEVPDRLDTASHNRITRAIESLTEHMNRNNRNRSRERSDGPGSRKPRSNSAAANEVRT